MSLLDLKFFHFIADREYEASNNSTATYKISASETVAHFQDKEDQLSSQSTAVILTPPYSSSSVPTSSKSFKPQCAKLGQIATRPISKQAFDGRSTASNAQDKLLLRTISVSSREVPIKTFRVNRNSDQLDCLDGEEPIEVGLEMQEIFCEPSSTERPTRKQERELW
ncbi:unnamed protein product [Protopolystoma xenopodis]|uniref:Uncharacterized protein n=1 Tax=Protopolystoma xenopodis TaxID=117903 RepID=A0A448WGX7_9PLAT|nr:unnamed protein product [Protopolystoma xenopodis]